MWEHFVNKDINYSLRQGMSLLLPPKKITGTNDLVFRAYQARNKLPKVLKLAPSLEIFKSGING